MTPSLDAAPDAAPPAKRRAGHMTKRSSRDRLLDAAIAQFARFGFEPVSTSSVAKAAGLTQSMVHYHFQSKVNLWKAAIDRVMHDRAAHFWVNEQDLRDLDPLSRLKVLTRRFMIASSHDPYISRISVHEAMQRSPRLSWLMERYIGSAYRLFDHAITEAIRLGQIKPLPVGDVTTLILTASAIPFVADAWTEELYGYRQSSNEQTESYIDTAMDILFSGLVATKPVADAVPRPASAEGCE